MAWWSLNGRASSNRTRRYFSKLPIRAPSTCRHWLRSALASAAFEEDRPMNPDDTVRDEKPEEQQDQTATRRIRKPDDPAPVSEGKEATPAEPSPEPLGWAAQIRQAMQRSPQGEARANIKREQLREDRTKAFLL